MAKLWFFYKIYHYYKDYDYYGKTIISLWNLWPLWPLWNFPGFADDLAPSCANCDLVLSIAVDKAPSLVLGVFPFLLVHCHIHLLTLLTPNRNNHYVQHS